MRRICAGIVSVALALTFVAPISASATVPTQSEMLREQVASQEMIGLLLGTNRVYNSWIYYITFGSIHKNGWTAKVEIPVSVHTRGGAIVNGVLVMHRGNGKWFFYSMTRGSSAGGISTVPIPAGITSSVVSTAMSEQIAHQSLLTGIATGGYKRLTVLSHLANWNTRTIKVKLTGGTRPSAYGTVTAYRKILPSANYWFLSTFK